MGAELDCSMTGRFKLAPGPMPARVGLWRWGCHQAGAKRGAVARRGSVTPTEGRACDFQRAPGRTCRAGTAGDAAVLHAPGSPYSAASRPVSGWTPGASAATRALDAANRATASSGQPRAGCRRPRRSGGAWSPDGRDRPGTGRRRPRLRARTVGAVNRAAVQVQRAGRAQLGQQQLVKLGPDAGVGPVPQPTPAGHSRAADQAGGQLVPGDPGLEDDHDPASAARSPIGRRPG